MKSLILQRTRRISTWIRKGSQQMSTMRWHRLWSYLTGFVNSHHKNTSTSNFEYTWNNYFLNLLALPHGIWGVLDPRPGIKLTASITKIVQSCPTLCNLMEYTIHGILQARTLEWVAFPFSKRSSQPRDQTKVSCIAGGFLLAEPQGKTKNTGVCSLSLLQQIFLTQELNRGLLHCRQILYQLNSQGSLNPHGLCPYLLSKT